MFDVGCNINGCEVGSVVVQKKGLESLYGDGGPVIEGNRRMHFNGYACKVIDNRKSVNCLAGVNHVYQPGLFLTTTLNSKQHPGVSCIRSLIEDMIDRLRSRYFHKPHVAKDYSDAMSQAAMVVSRV
eukprot:13562152-Ditylum_brightwellii.AAC.1